MNEHSYGCGIYKNREMNELNENNRGIKKTKKKSYYYCAIDLFCVYKFIFEKETGNTMLN